MNLSKVFLLLVPAVTVLAMDEQDDVLAAPLVASTLETDMQATKDDLQDRNTRDANPGVPPIIQKGGKSGYSLPVGHPLPAPPAPEVHASPAAHTAPHENPEYSPKKPPHVPTKAKCTVEEVEVKTKICTPTYQKQCSKVKLATKELVNRDKCFKIVRTVCRETVETKDNELCVYEYEEDQLNAEAKTVEVDYKKRCETTRQEYCPPQQGYGHGYCKHQNTKVCYNEPSLSSTTKSVKVGVPVAKKACQNNPVKIPKVECDDVEVEKCIGLPYAEDVEVSLDRCRAEVGEQQCEETVLTLPKQVCEEVKEAYHGPPRPAYQQTGPSGYGAPLADPAASYHAPAGYRPPARPAYAG